MTCHIYCVQRTKSAAGVYLDVGGWNSIRVFAHQEEPLIVEDDAVYQVGVKKQNYLIFHVVRADSSFGVESKSSTIPHICEILNQSPGPWGQKRDFCIVANQNVFDKIWLLIGLVPDAINDVIKVFALMPEGIIIMDDVLRLVEPPKTSAWSSCSNCN